MVISRPHRDLCTCWGYQPRCNGVCFVNLRPRAYEGSEVKGLGSFPRRDIFGLELILTIEMNGAVTAPQHSPIFTFPHCYTSTSLRNHRRDNRSWFLTLWFIGCVLVLYGSCPVCHMSSVRTASDAPLVHVESDDNPFIGTADASDFILKVMRRCSRCNNSAFSG